MADYYRLIKQEIDKPEYIGMAPKRILSELLGPGTPKLKPDFVNNSVLVSELGAKWAARIIDKLYSSKDDRDVAWIIEAMKNEGVRIDKNLDVFNRVLPDTHMVVLKKLVTEVPRKWQDAGIPRKPRLGEIQEAKRRKYGR